MIEEEAVSLIKKIIYVLSVVALLLTFFEKQIVGDSVI
jgi:hypothetical protein